MAGALVHEWIAQRGGSENVLEVLATEFSTAPIYSLWNDDPKRFSPERTHESWIARSPLRGRKALSLPLMPATWSRMDIGEPDWVIASSHAFAHHVGGADLRSDGRVFAYVHSPARYLWAPELDDRARGLSQFAAPLRSIDRRRAASTSHIAANSKFVADRILRSWGRESRVIYPPVRVAELQSTDWTNGLDEPGLVAIESLPGEYVMGASRFIPYKALHNVIRVGEALGMPVVLAGSGPDEERLRAVASSATVPVMFIISPSDSTLFAAIERASLFVFPAIEDFGILPAEAIALGTPILVNEIGGANEIVEATDGGATCEFQSGHEMKVAAEKAMVAWSAQAAGRIEKFSVDGFRSEVRDWVGVHHV